MDRVAQWWDGFELWVAGLPFIPQFLVVLAAMGPISFLLAYLLDRGLRLALRLLRRPDPNLMALEVSVPQSAADPREPAHSGVS